MGSVFLTYDASRGWIGPSIYGPQLPLLFDGDTSAAGGGVALGNGVDGGPQWNFFYFAQPSLPGNVLPVALQTTWFVNVVQNAGLAEQMILEVSPQPYVAGRVLLQFINGTPTPFPANYQPWDPRWPLDNILMGMYAGPNVGVTAVIAVLYYAEAPSVARFVVTPLTGGVVATTVRPTLVWSYVPGDFGGPQTARQILVYTQAQTQAAGFVAGVTPPIWDSLVVRSSLSSATVPINLANNTQYVAYLRVAQTINGSDQWSNGYTSLSFTISIPAASVPARPAVVATADSPNARIALTVTQSGSPSWDHVVVQRSVDDGDTWTVVRGGDVDIAPGATLSIWDYETGNGVQAVYRAQAQRTSTVGGLTQVTVSQFSPSSTAAAWTSTSVWLKSPLYPAFNMTVRLGQFGTFTRRMARGVFDVVGRSTPVVVSDVRHGLEGQMTVAVRSVAELNAIRFMSDLGTTVLLQAPPSFNFGSHYLALGDEHEDRVNVVATNAYRWVQFDFVEVDSPAGELVDTTTAPPVVIPPATGYILDESGNFLTDESGNRLTGI